MIVEEKDYTNKDQSPRTFWAIDHSTTFHVTDTRPEDSQFNFYPKKLQEMQIWEFDLNFEVKGRVKKDTRIIFISAPFEKVHLIT